MSRQTDDATLAKAVDELRNRERTRDLRHREVVVAQGKQAKELGRLTDRLAALDRSRHDVERQRARLMGRLDTVEQELADLPAAQQRGRAELDGMIGQLRLEILEDVGRLDGRIGWIERRLRRDQNPPPAALDAVDGWDDLVTLVHRVRDIERSLLTRAQLARHQATIDAYRALKVAADDHLDETVTASATVADTAMDSAAHRAAGREYRRHRQELAAAGQRVQAATAAFTDSQRAVSQHVSHGELHKPDLDAGHTAGRDLHGRLRDRVVAAVDEAALLPLWFTTVLRHQPPAAKAATWYSIAAEVLLFRITYSVTDLAVALGTEPTPEDDSHRANRHRDISRSIAGLWRPAG